MSVAFLTCDLNMQFINLSFFSSVFSQGELLKNVKYIILLALAPNWVSELFCTYNENWILTFKNLWQLLLLVAWMLTYN